MPEFTIELPPNHLRAAVMKKWGAGDHRKYLSPQGDPLSANQAELMMFHAGIRRATIPIEIYDRKLERYVAQWVKFDVITPASWYTLAVTCPVCAIGIGPVVHCDRVTFMDRDEHRQSYWLGKCDCGAVHWAEFQTPSAT